MKMNNFPPSAVVSSYLTTECKLVQIFLIAWYEWVGPGAAANALMRLDETLFRSLSWMRKREELTKKTLWGFEGPSFCWYMLPSTAIKFSAAENMAAGIFFSVMKAFWKHASCVLLLKDAGALSLPNIVKMAGILFSKKYDTETCWVTCVKSCKMRVAQVFK